MSEDSIVKFIDGQAVTEPYSLDELKAFKREAIDQRTVELIEMGFAWASKVFSLSEPAQINWIGLKNAVADGLLIPPVSVSTKDDNDYELADATEVNNFYATALGTKKAHLDSGRGLKTSVNAATTQAELDAVVDAR